MILKNRIYLLDVRPLYEKKIYQEYLKQINSERQRKLKRLKSVEKKALSLGAGILLDKVTRDYLGKMPRIDFNPYGKPDYEGENFHFNLSHSGYYAICGIGSKPLGVDVQEVRKGSFSLAKRFFHQDEFEFLKQLSDTQQEFAFSQIWSAKESYIKYVGKGLGIPLNKFSLKFDVGFDRWKVSDCSESGVYFKNYLAPEHYVIWFCSEIDDFAEEVVEIKLLNG